MTRFTHGTALAAALALAPAAPGGEPFLDAATFAGAAGQVRGKSLSLAPDGSIYIVGDTDSPALPNAINAKSGFSDIYVMKLSGDMTTLHWSRYMGGTGAVADLELATDCAATPDGGVVVTGKSETPDFPAINALDGTLGGPSDAVVFRLDGDGNVVFSTYLGGSGGENAEGAGFGKFLGEVEVAADGSIFVAGNTRSADFPLVDPIDGTFGGFNADVFVTKIAADGGVVLASTYLGDGFEDEVWDMRLDSEGRPVIVGNAGPGWPYTAGAYSFGTPSSSGIVYVTKLAGDARSIEWSARIDRSGESGGNLNFKALSIAPDGGITAVGDVTGSSFPVPDTAYQPTLSGGSPTRDAVVFSFSADGTALTAGTFLGDFNVGEVAEAVGVDSFGQVLVPVNISSSAPHPNRLYKFDPALTTLVVSPILLAEPAQTQQVRMDGDNNITALIAAPLGETTPGAFQETNPGGGPYVARWDMQDPPAADVPGDVDGDGSVGTTDLLALLSLWGPCADPCPPSCAADFDDDCTVGVTDFLLLLGNWG